MSNIVITRHPVSFMQFGDFLNFVDDLLYYGVTGARGPTFFQSSWTYPNGAQFQATVTGNGLSYSGYYLNGTGTIDSISVYYAGILQGEISGIDQPASVFVSAVLEEQSNIDAVEELISSFSYTYYGQNYTFYGTDAGEVTPEFTGVYDFPFNPAGDDNFYLGDGNDDFFAGDGDDLVEGGAGADTLDGGGGNDILNGGGGDDELLGGSNDDVLVGGLGADTLNGGTGTDFARYDTASTAVTVHLANDQVNTGEALGDTFTSIEGLYLTMLYDDVGFGDGNNNTLYGLGGNDTLNGGGGNDMLYGGLGADAMDGGADFDYARYDDAASGVIVYLANDRPNSGEAAGDTFTDIEGLYLSAHNDYGFGDDGANFIYGQGGGDSLAGGLGADYLDGGEGFDYARYDDAAYHDDIRVYLQSQYSNLNTGVAAIGDTFVSIEGLQTSVRNDTLFGNSENNILLGNLGTDNLYGFTGNDTLYGGAGDPNGDGVRDNFVFDQAPIAANADIVGDFERGLDQIALSTDIFGTDESRIQFNPDTSELVYTGVNGNEYNVIATLIGESVFDASDYYFY
ncbi:calcium-binding protein [Hoeflea sp.]|uniref:calcium-binding protein n=1 Tax=Hoeflea sp. TaxID=1940281 RepID=UPI003BAEDCF7